MRLTTANPDPGSEVPSPLSDLVSWPPGTEAGITPIARGPDRDFLAQI